MINNQDAGDIRGLEEVFRSRGVRARVGNCCGRTRRGRPFRETRRTHSRHAVRPPTSGRCAGETPGRVVRARRRWISGSRAADREGSAASFCVETTLQPVLDDCSVSALVALVAAGSRRGGSAPAVACRRPRTTWKVPARWWAQHLGCGVNGLGGTWRLARGRGRLRQPFGGRGHERRWRAWFGQRARWTRHPDWAGDLHRRSGLASGAVGGAPSAGGGAAGSPPPCGHRIRPLPSCRPSGAR